MATSFMLHTPSMGQSIDISRAHMYTISIIWAI